MNSMVRVYLRVDKNMQVHHRGEDHFDTVYDDESYYDAIQRVAVRLYGTFNVNDATRQVNQPGYVRWTNVVGDTVINVIGTIESGTS